MPNRFYPKSLSKSAHTSFSYSNRDFEKRFVNKPFQTASRSALATQRFSIAVGVLEANRCGSQSLSKSAHTSFSYSNRDFEKRFVNKPFQTASRSVLATQRFSMAVGVLKANRCGSQSLYKSAHTSFSYSNRDFQKRFVNKPFQTASRSALAKQRFRIVVGILKANRCLGAMLL